MSITKYASFEVSQILDIKGAPTRQHTASLNKVAEYDKYRTSDGFMYVRIRAISSRVNQNSDGWPSIELAGDPEVFERHSRQSSGGGFSIEASETKGQFGFPTFIGKPIFVDHHNSDPKRARGVIVDSKLHVLDHKTAAEGDEYWGGKDVDPEHMPPTEIELLLEVDAKQFPKYAKAILDGDLDGFSMGADVEMSKCSHCGHEATTPDEYCSHIVMKGAEHDFKTADGKRIAKKSYENCYKLKFFEISGVFDPADKTALTKEVRSSVHKEGILENALGPEGALDPIRTNDEEVRQRIEHLVLKGMDPAAAADIVTRQMQPRGTTPGYGEGISPEIKRKDYMPLPGVMPPVRQPQIAENPGVHGLNPEFYDAAQDALDERYPHRPTMNDPRWSSTHTAEGNGGENPLPQSMHTTAPEEVDTLREEQTCPICGEDMDGETCDVCGYVKPPKGMDNPDLDKAEQVKDEMKEGDMEAVDDPQSAAPGEDGGNQGPPQGPAAQPKQNGSWLGGGGSPTKPQATASVISDMRWRPILNPKTAGRINPVEVPNRPVSKPATNEPKETIISDPGRPVTSAMLTAQTLIAAAKRNNPGDTMSTRTADGTTAPGAAPDKRVDVTGVGGITNDNNQKAWADKQVNVEGIGGTGVEGVEPDEHQTLKTAPEGSDNSGFAHGGETGHKTETWTGTGGNGVNKQESPVTKKVPSWVEESKWSSFTPAQQDAIAKIAYDDTVGEHLQDVPSSPANQGVQPIDSAGKPDKRVNLLEHTTSPSNNSGKTDTWHGTDGNGVNKQQDPVTKEVTKSDGITSKVAAMIRLTDVEVAMGLLSRDDKWSRFAALEHEDEKSIIAQLHTLARVKTAGLSKQASRTAGAPRRLPSFKHVTADVDKTEPETVDQTTFDSGLFTR